MHNWGCFLQADAGILQLQNQQLVQQIDIKKRALQELEEKVGDLKGRQNSYDDLLIALNQHWNQVILSHHLLLPSISVCSFPLSKNYTAKRSTACLVVLWGRPGTFCHCCRMCTIV